MPVALLLESLGLQDESTTSRGPSPDLLQPSEAHASAPEYYAALRQRIREAPAGVDPPAADRICAAGVWALCRYLHHALTG